jgi:hypothetical protein
MYNFKKILLLKNSTFALLLLIALLFPTRSISFDKIPWDDKGDLHVLINLEKSDVWSSFIGKEFSKEYHKRFGVYPTFMILKDMPRPIKVRWEFDFWRTRANWDYQSTWGDSLLWGDVRKYLFWRLESAKTGKVIFLPVTQGDPNANISKGVDRNGWLYKLEFDLNELDIPDDGASHRLSIEMHENDPEDGKGKIFKPSTLQMIPEVVNEIFVAKSTLQTPMDHYLLGVMEGTLGADGDKELLLMLQDHFKYATTISKSLLIRYYREKNADSVRWIAPYFLKSYERGMNPFVNSMDEDFKKMHAGEKEGEYSRIHISGWGEQKLPIEWVHEMLFKLDGDTTIFK